MTSGIFLVDKPRGISSAKAIAQIKRRVDLKKIGHAGTLDPLASGLLVCLVGSATRLAKYASQGFKLYSGTIRLGLETDTDDIAGGVVATSEHRPSDDMIEAIRTKYLGKIVQVPPKVSAVKIDGERAYSRALRGEDFVITPREVQITQSHFMRVSKDVIRFQVRCSGGTYIRALARDVGRELGCGACIESLRREESLPFSVTRAKPLELVGLDDILDIRELFPSAPVLCVDTNEARRLRNGDIRSVDAVLDRFSSTLNGVAVGGELICSERNSGNSLGLLVQDHGKWEIGLILN